MNMLCWDVHNNYFHTLLYMVRDFLVSNISDLLYLTVFLKRNIWIIKLFTKSVSNFYKYKEKINLICKSQGEKSIRSPFLRLNTAINIFKPRLECIFLPQNQMSFRSLPHFPFRQNNGGKNQCGNCNVTCFITGGKEPFIKMYTYIHV